MPRIALPAPYTIPEASRPILDAIGKQLGFVPNMFHTASISPAVLVAMTGFSAALSRTLDVKTRERIALAISAANKCGYCLAAHTYVGVNMAKLTVEEIMLNRQGGSSDSKADAAVRFAVAVAESRGHVGDAEIAAVNAAGFSEAQVLEIVAVVALSLLNNLVNNVARPEIDFPFQGAKAAAA
jgi:uncharacterized peroxidase-related enzyme